MFGSKKKEAALSHSRLLEALSYNPDSGTFVWNIAKNSYAGKVKIGAPAGSKHKGDGYIQITIDQVRQQAHRLAWFYVHGVWPKEQLDHINGVRDDNRIVNLREVSVSENRKNLRLRDNNTSGRIGVSWAQRDKRWRAAIQVNGKMIYIGNFKEFEDAVKAREIAEKHYGFHENHGRTHEAVKH